MKKDLDEELCRKYPLIFKDRNGPMDQTSMCWGFDIDDGWYPIINMLCISIQNHIDQVQRDIDWTIKFNADLETAKNNNWENWADVWGKEPRTIPDPIEQVVATQVKEKFGTLRFYYCGGDNYIRGLVDMAENMSGVMCEVCGSPGWRRRGSWFRTLCEEHRHTA